MQNEDPVLPIVGKDKNAPAQRPGVPKLILPATSLRRAQTRQEREEKRKPKGYAPLDVGDFAARMLPYQRQLRKGAFSTCQLREQAQIRKDSHYLRPFFPQSGVKVERADTNANDKARGRVYLTLSNGQVVRPDKLLRKGRSVPLLQKTMAYLDAQTSAEQAATQ